MGLAYRTPKKDPNRVKSDVYNGAIVHVLGSKGLENGLTYIVDATPDGSQEGEDGTHSFFLSVLPVGNSFTDPMSGITAKVDSITWSERTSLLTISVSGIPMCADLPPGTPAQKLEEPECVEL